MEAVLKRRSSLITKPWSCPQVLFALAITSPYLALIWVLIGKFQIFLK